jgi:hypothetical protein
MHPSKSLTKFNKVLAVWEQALDGYSEADFLRKPDEDAWSIGQVYVHLVGSAKVFHLRQATQCLENPAHQNEGKTMPGRIVYFLGGMLPMRIKVPPSPQYTPPQPQSIGEIREKIAALKPLMTEMADRIAQQSGSGKTTHPAFGHLNAEEWFQLIDMHFRHHLRQKRRLDTFLANG